MASTYTTDLKLTKMGNGEDSGTWGTITNTNWDLIEQAVAGVVNIPMTNANYTLTNLNGTSDEARNMVLNVTGSNSAVYQVIVPSNQSKFYVVSNNTSGSYAITVGTNGIGGALVSIPNGVTAQVYCDGTNTYSAQTGSAGNFLVNGNLSVTGNQVDVGNMSVGGTFSVTGTSSLAATSFSVSPTAPTPSVGDNSTKVATTAFVAASPAILTGSLLMWPTASAPSGYLLCNGAAVSRTTYATLFGVIGTTFGSGDGSTTFNLPNYQDRMPIGVGTTAASIGDTGGSATTTLSTANLPSHTHTAIVTDPGHSHTIAGNFATFGGGGSSGPNNSLGIASNTNSATTGISVTNSSTGSGTAATTISPYIGINFIIKT
jgi:microcystin-dependent protein